MAWVIRFPLQIVAMGMLASDSLQFEDLVRVCDAEGRFEFMVVGLPLRLPGGTGSPWNPIAHFRDSGDIDSWNPARIASASQL